MPVKKRTKPRTFRNISELIKFTKREIAAEKVSKPKILSSKKPRIITSKPVPEIKVNPKTRKLKPIEPRKLRLVEGLGHVDHGGRVVKPLHKEPSKLRLVEGLGHVDREGRVVKPLHKEPSKLHDYDPKTDTFRGKDGRRYHRKTNKPVN